MVIMKVDLETAVKEFHSMASTLVYRSSSTKLAKEVGHRAFGPDRMNEFWIPMREALRAVNPNASYEEEVGGSVKRSRDTAESTQSPGEKKKRRLEV
jgi:hypothetical protein